MKRAPVLFSCSVLLLLFGCTTFIPATPTDYETTVDGSRDVVFESLLSVAQRLNLSVDVLEKQSGFVQFKNAMLSAEQLDMYCRYPFAKKNTTEPASTFVEWSHRAGHIRGSVSLSILVSQLPANTTNLKIHSTWAAGTSRDTYSCTSLAVLEKEMEAALRIRLGSPLPPAVLGIGTKLFNKDGSPFGIVMEISGSTVRVKHVQGSLIPITRDQALAMMQK